MKIAVLVCAVCLVILVDSDANAQVTLSSRFSEVTTTDFDTGDSVSESTGELGLFEESVSLGSSFSTSTSSILSTIFDIEVTSQGGESAVFSEALAYTLVEFEVESTLIVQVNGTFTTSDADDNSSALWASLSQSGSEVFDFDLAAEQLTLNDSFVLTPGEYRFETNANSMGDATPGAFLAADFTVSFIAVPEPSSATAVVLLLVPQVLRRKRAAVG